MSLNCWSWQVWKAELFLYRAEGGLITEYGHDLFGEGGGKSYLPPSQILRKKKEIKWYSLTMCFNHKSIWPPPPQDEL